MRFGQKPGQVKGGNANKILQKFSLVAFKYYIPILEYYITEVD